MPIHKYVNKDFFKVWTPEMAYIVGFFAADGYMTKNKRGAHFWNLEIKDKALLEKIKGIIQSEHKISLRYKKDCIEPLYRLQIGRKDMYEDLRNLGFTQGKTWSLAVPEVPAFYFRDFVRGYFDGDGCVWLGIMHKERSKSTNVIRVVFTSCSRKFLEELCRRMRLHFVFGGVLCKGRGNFYRLTYSVHGSLKMYDFMYNLPVLDTESLFLDRKKTIFEKFISMRP